MARSSETEQVAANPYRVEWAKFPTGERVPLLVRKATGLPIQSATYWIGSSQRPTNLAANSLKDKLRDLMFFFLWCYARRRDPDEVAGAGLMSLDEVNDLSRFCGLTMKGAVEQAVNAMEGRDAGNVSVLSEARQRRSARGAPVIGKGASGRAEGAPREVAGDRLATFCSFFEFCTFAVASRLAPLSDDRKQYDRIRGDLLKVLRAKAGGKRKRVADRPYKRMGMAASDRDRLLAVIEPDHPDNPWEPEFRERNRLVLRLLYDLGMRRGEVLCLRVDDVRLTADGGLLTIVRRPQDPLDPREPKPQVKTLGRELTLGPELRALFLGCLAARRKVSGIRRHPFLVINHQDGAPLSASGFDRLMEGLKSDRIGLPKGFTAHVLRHDWNDRFSDDCDKNPRRDSQAAESEAEQRAYLMGWKNPDTARWYTRRWVMEAANKRLLKQQARRSVIVRGAEIAASKP